MNGKEIIRNDFVGAFGGAVAGAFGAPGGVLGGATAAGGGASAGETIWQMGNVIYCDWKGGGFGQPRRPSAT